MWKSVLLALALLASGVASPALSDPAEWAPNLRAQLRKTEGCEVLYLTGTKEYRLFDRDIVEARAHCEDGRAFDVIRRSRAGEWVTVLCKPMVC